MCKYCVSAVTPQHVSPSHECEEVISFLLPPLCDARAEVLLVTWLIEVLARRLQLENATMCEHCVSSSPCSTFHHHINVRSDLFSVVPLCDPRAEVLLVTCLVAAGARS